jgi:hypothetical protein
VTQLQHRPAPLDWVSKAAFAGAAWNARSGSTSPKSQTYFFLMTEVLLNVLSDQVGPIASRGLAERSLEECDRSHKNGDSGCKVLYKAAMAKTRKSDGRHCGKGRSPVKRHITTENGAPVMTSAIKGVARRLNNPSVTKRENCMATRLKSCGMTRAAQ